MKGRREARALDECLSAYVDFAGDPIGADAVKPGDWIPDTEARGLFARIGRRLTSFYFVAEHRRRGKRVNTCKLLGHYPGLSVRGARIEARKLSGKVAEGSIGAGKREAIRFETGLARYISYLERRAEDEGKPPRSAKNVEGFGRRLLLPKWSGWSLDDMSQSAGAIADWHVEVGKKHGRVTANRVCQLIRTIYLRESKRADPPLPHALPTRAVDFFRERPRQIGIELTRGAFGAWRRALEAIPHPMHRAYHWTALACGARPGELLRLRWSDIDVRRRLMTLRRTKSGLDVSVPLSAAIVRGLRMARDAARAAGPKATPRGAEADRVFYGAAKAPERDVIPVRGHGLRHSYRTICADLGIDDATVAMLMGHSLQGVGRGYIARAIVSGGPGLREAQRKISRRIISLLFKSSAQDRSGQL